MDDILDPKTDAAPITPDPTTPPPETDPPEPRPYKDVGDQYEGANRGLLNLALVAASKHSADERAKRMADAAHAGVLVPWADENPAETARLARLRQSMAQAGSLDRHPELAQWASNPNHAAVASDSFPGLKILDHIVSVAQSKASGTPIPDITGTLPAGFMWGRDGQIYEPFRSGEGINSQPIGTVDDLERVLTQRGYNHFIDEMNQQATAKRLTDALGGAGGGYNPLVHIAAGMAQSLAGYHKLIGNGDSTTDDADKLAQVSQELAPGLTGNVLRLGGQLAGDLPLLMAGGAAPDILLGATEAQATAKSAELARQFTLATGQTVRAGRYAWQAADAEKAAEALSLISRTRTMLSPIMGVKAANWLGRGVAGATAFAPAQAKADIALGRDQGPLAAIGDFLASSAIMTGIGPVGPTKFLISPTERATAAQGFGFIGTVLRDTALMGAQNYSLTWSQAIVRRLLGDGTPIDPWEIHAEAAKAGELGALVGGIFAIAGRPGLQKRYHEAVANHAGIEFGDQLQMATDTLAATPLQKRSPALMQSAISSMGLKDASQNVFMRPGDWQEHWLAQGMDPVAMAEKYGVKDAYVEGQATGAEMAIPAGSYLQSALESKDPHGLHGKARIAPGAPSPEEGAIWHHKVESEQLKEFQAMADKSLAAVTDDHPALLTIKEDQRQQLATLRPDWTASQVDTISTLWARTMVGLARMSSEDGVTPVDPWTLHKSVSLGSDIPSSVRTAGVDRLRAMLEKIQSGADSAKESEQALQDLGEHAKAIGAAVDQHTLDTVEERIRTAAGEKFDPAAQTLEQAPLPSVSIGPHHFSEKKSTTTGQMAFNTPIYLADGSHLSGFTSKDHSVFYGYEKNGDAFTLLPRGVDPNSIISDDATSSYVKKYLTNNKDQLSTYEQAPSGEGARGSYKPLGDGKARISIGKDADASTVIHELGHYAFDVMTDLANREGAPKQLLNDVQTIMDHLGVKDLASWNAMDFEERRQFHEKYAQSFESYFMSGKAPVPELKSVFRKIRDLIVKVYKSIEALVELKPEVRDVFDRLIASNDELERARLDMSDEPLFKDASTAKMTPDEFATYLKENAKNIDTENGRLGDDVMASLQRKLTDNYKSEETTVREGMANIVNERPEFRAMLTLQKGEMPDGTAIKLDRAELVKLYGEDGLRDLPGRTGFSRNPNRGNSLYAEEGGISLDTAATILGYRSGSELWEAMTTSGNRKMTIDAMTAKEMNRRHPDPVKDGTLSEEATDILHNGARSRRLWKELAGLAKSSGDNAPPIELLRSIAQDNISKRQVSSINPEIFSRAEARSAKDVLAAVAKGDFKKAYALQMQRLLNAELYRAARDAKSEIDKSTEYQKKFGERSTRERIGKAGGFEWMVQGFDQKFPTQESAKAFSRLNNNAPYSTTSSYIGQIDSLRERFGFTTIRMPGQREQLTQWIADQQAQGSTVIIPDWIAKSDKPINYRDLNTDQFADVIDSMRNIEHIAKTHNKMSAIMKGQAFDVVRDDVVKSIKENAKSKPRGVKAGRDLMTGIRDTASGMVLSLNRLGDIVQRMDGYHEGGMMWDVLKRPFDEAAEKSAAYSIEASTELRAAFDAWEKGGGRGRARDPYVKDFIPEINQSLSRLERVMVALNWGNEGNRVRLMEGFNWNEAQAQAVLSTLDAHDADLVRGIAKIVNRHWSDIVAKQQRVSGVAPTKVEGSPFILAGEMMDGFYFPVVYDRAKSADTAQRELAAAADMTIRGAFTSSTTRRGHTQERGTGTGAPLSLDTNAIARHLHNVFHDLTHHEALLDATKILRDDQVSATIESYYGVPMVKALSNAMERIAGSSVRDVDGLEKAIRVMNRNIGRSAMGWSVWTAVQNVTGIFQSMERVGSIRFMQAMAPLVGNADAQQTLRSFVHGKSPYMVRRAKISGEQPREQTTTGIDAVGTNAPDIIRPYAMMEGIQQLVDLPTWKAAYDHALELGHDEAKSVLLGDQAVVDAQAGRDVKDKAAILEGSEFKKTLTLFYSYFNSTFNMSQRAVSRTQWKDPASVARLAQSFLLLYAVPTAITIAGMAALRPDQRRDKKPLPGRMTAETLAMMAATIPGIREFASGIKGDPYGGPAGMRGFDAINKLIVQIRQGVADRSLGHASLGVLGLVSGLPTVQGQRTLDGIIYDVDHGTANPLPILFGPKK